MNDKKYIYMGNKFNNINIQPLRYKPEYFNTEIELESEIFYELRKKYNIYPHRLIDGSKKELNEIRTFFESHKETFFFLFDNHLIIGSILIIKNYIQSLSIAKKYQRQGYGKLLTQYAINFIIKEYPSVELRVMEGNIPAQKLYEGLGFSIFR
jgi:ribosomal protein S18 acetylase RimI-like enzyme